MSSNHLIARIFLPVCLAAVTQPLICAALCRCSEIFLCDPTLFCLFFRINPTLWVQSRRLPVERSPLSIIRALQSLYCATSFFVSSPCQPWCTLQATTIAYMTRLRGMKEMGHIHVTFNHLEGFRCDETCSFNKITKLPVQFNQSVIWQ
jgi:hypothetical protein